MTITTLVSNEREAITHEGTSGFTVTAQRATDNIGLEVLMEFDLPTREEGVAMVGAFLVQMEGLCGESFVADCLAHYAQETGKQFMEAGDHKVTMIRGGTRGKPPTKGRRG